MERYGRKLTDVLHRRVPCHAVVEVGHNTNVDASLASLFNHADDELLVARDREENLVDEERASEGEAVANIADHVGVATLSFALGEGDKAFETDAEMLERIEMVAYRM